MSEKKFVRIDGFIYSLSTNKDKKLDAYDPRTGKKVSFGKAGYSHYRDRTELLPETLEHHDEERRKRYLKRHDAIKTKNGKQADRVVGTPAWHAKKILW